MLRCTGVRLLHTGVLLLHTRACCTHGPAFATHWCAFAAHTGLLWRSTGAQQRRVAVQPQASREGGCTCAATMLTRGPRTAYLIQWSPGCRGAAGPLHPRQGVTWLCTRNLRAQSWQGRAGANIRITGIRNLSLLLSLPGPGPVGHMSAPVDDRHRPSTIHQFQRHTVVVEVHIVFLPGPLAAN